MIKNVIFDIGNVLVKFRPDEAMRELGFTEDAISKIAIATYENSVWAELDRGVASEPDIINKMVAFLPEYENEIRLFFEKGKNKLVKAFDYANDWIKELQSRGFKVYLLSNYPKDYFELHSHNELSFTSIVDGMIISGIVKLIKPEAEIYNCLLNTYSLKPDECVFIDDKPENIIAGEKLGIHGIVFVNYEDAKNKLEELIE